ncbi:MAG TPA: hypothetical protein VFE05_06115 [Longimicrobiaceae bacterium]|nr:hypothetical protein [Longimicrobiaceae bacterium]
MSEPADFVRAKFDVLRDGSVADTFDVHFNPVSLSYSITNQTSQQGSASANTTAGTQFQTQSTGKLTMDLVFDTTSDGQDVRTFTEKVAKTMQPDATSRVPPTVKFTWGVYTFEGLVEGYKETLDFFSPNGVPLRAAVNLTLSATDPNKVFTETQGAQQDFSATLAAEAVQVPAPAGKGGAAAIANALGVPNAARAIGAMNGQASLRFSAGASLKVGVGVKASAGAKIGASLSIGGGGAISVKASAGSQSAFSGLRTPPKPKVTIDGRKLLPKPPTTGLATDRGATFGVGGRANIESAASLKADVGSSGNLGDRIRFGEG